MLLDFLGTCDTLVFDSLMNKKLKSIYSKYKYFLTICLFTVNFYPFNTLLLHKSINFLIINHNVLIIKKKNVLTPNFRIVVYIITRDGYRNPVFNRSRG